ncbi:MAG TPA: accessory Sec system translocase SecA2 [Thermoanaerobaculia bacterium]|jgi:preprotein translocase subunit SecA|nr:accessory Sec system translocase SecA2 [Thermoanaerobaculia bacterium]
MLEAINARGAELSRAEDPELSERAASLRRQARGGTTLETLLPDVFTLVRETAFRILGERPYDVQMLAGIALHQGKLVEMQTGEGKTLAAVAPVVLNALTGRGVHVLTYNDYLARRDAEWMGPVYERLGLTVGSIREGLSAAERRRAYGCDVTYLTVKEAGFDLLRDGLCLDPAAQVHRPFHLGLVDEADSLLIDEARIPLVIAGTLDEVRTDLGRLAGIARRMQRGADYDTDEYAFNIFLTDSGIHRAEELLGSGNLFEGDNVRLQAELRNALHAEALLKRDVDYIVRNGRIELVDELTGRVAENRHWPDGLQAALEAKEGLRWQAEGKIFGSITVQHFLRKYPRLCGMTGTAMPAAAELADIYNLEVLEISPNRPCIRVDHPDVIHATREAKRRALTQEISATHATGRPILVGTVSVEESESLAADLLQTGLSCRVLNAKNDAEEAAIVAEAGALGAVTISTNMAGRGTDIRLGGADESQRDAVVALGGLYVLGTNRHESRRVDDQLRGRAGRQGDPGSSRFIISLEDSLLQRCGIERLLPSKIQKRLKAGEEPGGSTEIDHPAVRREVARVQRIVEGQHGDIRKRLLSYWEVLEHQRVEVQAWRQAVLEGKPQDLLEQRSPERWTRLCAEYGEDLLREIERRITLVMIDRCWSDHIAEMQAVRDEVHLVVLGGRDPYAEFYRAAGAGFEALVDRIDDTIVETFERIRITAEGVDWDREGLRGPSSTWTYLINDNVFGNNTFLTLSNRPGFGLWAILLCWWILVPWAMVLRWRNRKKKD